MRLLEIHNDARQNMVAEGCPGAYLYAAFYKAGYFGNIFFSQGIQCEDVLRVFVKDFAGDGKVDRSACPVEELCLVYLFKRLHLQAYGRLREMYDLGSLREALCLGDGAENLEFMIFHSHGFIL